MVSAVDRDGGGRRARQKNRCLHQGLPLRATAVGGRRQRIVCVRWEGWCWGSPPARSLPALGRIAAVPQCEGVTDHYTPNRVNTFMPPAPPPPPRLPSPPTTGDG